jgi:hypothetical protein
LWAPTPQDKITEMNPDSSGLLDPANMGRFGGILTIIVGIALSVGGWVLWEDRYFWSALLGPVLIILGTSGYRRASVRAKLETPQISADQLKAVVQNNDVGFLVCTRCRTIMDRDFGNGCLRCGSVAECLEVMDEDDRRIALAAIA